MVRGLIYRANEGTYLEVGILESPPPHKKKKIRERMLIIKPEEQKADSAFQNNVF